MRHILLIVGVLAFNAVDAMPAEIVEVQVPQLIGSYCMDSSCVNNHHVHFGLSRHPLAVYHVWLHLSGTVTVGEYMCDFYGGMPEGPYPYRMDFLASMRDTVGGYWWMAEQWSSEQSGHFEITIPFRELYGWPVTWDFLRAGYGSFGFSAGPQGTLVDCWHLVWPNATIDEAALIIEGEFEVAVESSTWGSIKSLYR